MSDVSEDRPLITEEWLRSVGFKWSQVERQPAKHWILWLEGDELGIELEINPQGSAQTKWFCWLRSDTAGLYHRFIHVRYLTFQDELIRLMEALSGRGWNPENHLYGVMRSPEYAASMRREQERLDQRMLRERTAWCDHEKDADRARPLPEHLDQARKAGLAK